MHLSKPNHNKYLFRNCSPDEYCKLAESYLKAKKYGIRGIYGWYSGSSALGIAKEVAKGTVVSWGRRKVGSVIIVSVTWLTGPVVPMITNSTKALKIARNVHTCGAFVFECVKDSSNLTFFPFDLAFFGQPIPVGQTNRFNILGNFTDFLNLED